MELSILEIINSILLIYVMLKIRRIDNILEDQKEQASVSFLVDDGEIISALEEIEQDTLKSAHLALVDKKKMH